jgi:hypothetical protein
MNALTLNTGDLVIGTNDPTKSVYSSEGKKLIDSGVAIVGEQEDIDQLQSTIKNMAERTGAQITENKKAVKGGAKAVKKIKRYTTIPKRQVEETTDYEHFSIEPEKVKTTQVYFENDFGKIRSAVEQVVEQELAFMLVFAQEEDIVFEPKIGETLDFTHNRVTYQVYYPGVIFDWTDGVKKVMILFKLPKENE